MPAAEPRPAVPPELASPKPVPPEPVPPEAGRRAVKAPVAAHRRAGGWLRLVLLVLVIVVLSTMAAVFRGQADRATTGAANNRAVIDTGANTEVVGQISKAIETVLSYDFNQLDENERAARDVITGGYVAEYEATFADIRRTATEQKVVLKTTVLLAGVKQLGADRAELIATMNLDSVRDGAPASAPGRVRVIANRVDGRWKIAQMELL